MKTLSKELFISTIKALRDQQDVDFKIANALSKIYGEVSLYNNLKLTKVLFEVLEYFYPEKILDIKTFCFELDYGRNIKTENCPIEELWYEMQPRYIAGCDPFKVTTPTFPIHVSPEDINNIEVEYTIVSPIKKFSIEND